MKIHHLNCGSMCPYGKKAVNGHGGWLEPAELCCHCLLLEMPDGLTLIDTGLGTKDLSGAGKIPLSIRLTLRPDLNPELSALNQIRKLGFNAEDVKNILVTHLDFDHAGGIVDFPNAKIHVFADEHDAAMYPRSFMERQRYMKYQWAHRPDWQIHKLQGDSWEGFEGVRTISNAETDVLLVPMTGHTRGHCAIAVKNGDSWLLHCGDAYFFHGEMEAEPYCTPGLSIFQRQLAYNDKLRIQNQARLRDLNLNAEGNIHLFCAHDPVELERMKALSLINSAPQTQRKKVVLETA